MGLCFYLGAVICSADFYSVVVSTRVVCVPGTGDTAVDGGVTVGVTEAVTGVGAESSGTFES